MSAVLHKATKRVYLKRKAIASIPAITPIGSKEPVSKSLPRAVRRIAQELQPEKIILFGSYAYGQPTGDSDVDLLVVMDTKELSEVKRGVAVLRILVPRDFAVDVLVKTPTELDALLARKHFFYREIVSMGKVLYERQP
jgi:predicted nucleotidyltransferase